MALTTERLQPGVQPAPLITAIFIMSFASGLSSPCVVYVIYAGLSSGLKPAIKACLRLL